MTTVKVKFHPSTDKGCKGTIIYQVIHERKSRQIFTEYKIYPEEWDDNRSTVTALKKSERKPYIRSIREFIRRDVERITNIIFKLNNKGLAYTADDIVEEFNRYSYEYSLFNFMESIIIRLKQNGKLRTSETYTVALNNIKRFRQNEDIMLDCINAEMMESYEAWQKQRGIAPNTISFYMRIIRAVYNRAVENGVIENRNPFRHVYTGVDKTVKRALPLSIIKKIKYIDLSGMPMLDYARDMFMLSFMLRGMSFIDMTFLRKTDRSNGYVSYRRRKTGQQLTIRWTKEMQVILDKYPENSTDYLLPIIKKSGTNERCVYRNMGYNINHNLKKIGKMVGISIPLTLYVARHSWASAAKGKGIPLSVISEGMGHNNESTTQIYLASLDTSEVDKANSIILKSL